MEQWCRRMVLARGCTALAQGCNVVLSLRTLELVVALSQWLKELPKMGNNSVRKLQRVAKRGSRRPPGKYLYLIPGGRELIGGRDDQLSPLSFGNRAV